MEPAASFMHDFFLVLIPLFVAMEPVGLIPIYLSMTRAMDEGQKRNVLFYSVVTAAAITIAFLLVGRAVFLALGITISDFQIAGGLILLSIAIVDIVHTARMVPGVPVTIGVGIVPIGTPLIAGPAALTTLLMLSDLYGFTVTLSALLVNLVIVWLVFFFAERIVGYIGENGALGVSKVISLLLAAIAVMMIRRGLETLF
ncbi:MAG: MarC family protein [Thermodesulfobacteriota bacterium]|nr:MAG: MarC family protein [Thermodesulfobacteriota bacterium]